MARWMSVDYGVKRIGLAVGDDQLRLASPSQPLPGAGSTLLDARNVAALAKQQQAIGILVGVPFNMDGTEGPQATLTRRFIAALRQELGELPVREWDERLSSFAADERLRDRRLSRGGQKKRRDSVAALIMLEAFFESSAHTDLKDP